MSAEWHYHDGVSYFVSSHKETGSLAWWNTSITHIPCESVSACGRKGREQAKQGGKERKNVPRSHHVISVFFPFYMLQWLHVCSLGLLANFSKPSQLSVSLALFFFFIIQQLTFPSLFFFPVVWRVSGVPALVSRSIVLEGRRGTHGEADI